MKKGKVSVRVHAKTGALALEDCGCAPAGPIRPLQAEDLARIRNMRGELLKVQLVI